MQLDKYRSLFLVVVAYAVGFYHGGGGLAVTVSRPTAASQSERHPLVRRLVSTATESVNHAGSGVVKDVLLSAEEHDVPNLLQLAVATFAPGEAVPRHSHDTMFEIFFNLPPGADGGGGAAVEFTFDDTATVTADAGTLVVIPPGTPHQLSTRGRPGDESASTSLLYFGLAADVTS